MLKTFERKCDCQEQKWPFVFIITFRNSPEYWTHHWTIISTSENNWNIVDEATIFHGNWYIRAIKSNFFEFYGPIMKWTLDHNSNIYFQRIFPMNYSTIHCKIHKIINQPWHNVYMLQQFVFNNLKNEVNICCWESCGKKTNSKSTNIIKYLWNKKKNPKEMQREKLYSCTRHERKSVQIWVLVKSNCLNEVDLIQISHTVRKQKFQNIFPGHKNTGHEM